MSWLEDQTQQEIFPKQQTLILITEQNVAVLYMTCPQWALGNLIRSLVNSESDSIGEFLQAKLLPFPRIKLQVCVQSNKPLPLFIPRKKKGTISVAEKKNTSMLYIRDYNIT